jgi:GNAT superfamily N-acetyltransferase
LADDHAKVVYRVCPSVPEGALEALFATAWGEPSRHDFSSVLRHSLAFVCAYHEERLIGFVNLAWDGGIHAFLLDTTVHPDFRRRGIGRRLVRRVIEVARDRGIEWVHVDFEPCLRDFYRRCGFRSTEAGLMRLDPDART